MQISGWQFYSFLSRLKGNATAPKWQDPGPFNYQSKYFLHKNNLFDHKTVPFFSPIKILIPGSSGNVGELSTLILGDLSDLTRIAFERGFAKARLCLWQKKSCA